MNWQNIPRDNKLIKRAVLPKRGAFSFADYSQIEPRLFGYFTARALGDTTIADWYREGRDVYREISGRALGKAPEDVTEEERQDGKVTFLMSLYGAGPRKIGEQLGWDYDAAKEFYLAFHDGLPQIKRLSNPRPQSAKALRFWEPGAIERVIQKRGYLKNPHGRHLHVPQYGEHKMLNTLIQGSAADLMKASLIRVDAWIQENRDQLETRMVSTIHDEIIFDGPEHEIPVLHEHVPDLMREDWLTEVIPIEVDHEVSTTTWADKISYEAWFATQEVAAA